ncbi:hypothetical protein DFH07DRAFT_772071 [Mycena maculata]|uniref:Uncharacterized protein n=1 Tax=Mycena maculata TaxID=230809 RepID=A0AAD7JBM0_9AGAR|nr:hypothetical protein DFH07DRAFT_772071 [Mycena maculata]
MYVKLQQSHLFPMSHSGFHWPPRKKLGRCEPLNTDGLRILLAHREETLPVCPNEYQCEPVAFQQNCRPTLNLKIGGSYWHSVAIRSATTQRLPVKSSENQWRAVEIAWIPEPAKSSGRHGNGVVHCAPLMSIKNSWPTSGRQWLPASASAERCRSPELTAPRVLLMASVLNALQAHDLSTLIFRILLLTEDVGKDEKDLDIFVNEALNWSARHEDMSAAISTAVPNPFSNLCALEFRPPCSWSTEADGAPAE